MGGQVKVAGTLESEASMGSVEKLSYAEMVHGPFSPISSFLTCGCISSAEMLGCECEYNFLTCLVETQDNITCILKINLCGTHMVQN